jgi:hypothetical protein
MLSIAALFDVGLSAFEPPAVQLIGAAPLVALMAAARVELGRERASSCCAGAPNSALACGSAPQARVERR